MKTILMADSNESYRTMILERLQVMGISQVTPVAGVIDALDELERHTFDLLIMGFSFEDGSGNDIITAAHRQNPVPKIAVISGFDEEGAQERGLDLDQIDIFIFKPSEHRELPVFLREIGFLEPVHVG